MKLFFWLLFCMSFPVWSFEGTLTYDILESKPQMPGNFELLLGVGTDKVRFDTFLVEKSSKALVRTVIYDYPKKKLYIIRKKGEDEYDISQPYVQPSFMPPEEITPTKQKKKILDYGVEEYETFFFDNKNRLKLTSWYAPSLKFEDFKPIWHLHKINVYMSMINFLFMPENKQISLDTTFKRVDGSISQFKCTKVSRGKLPSDYFDREKALKLITSPTPPVLKPN